MDHWYIVGFAYAFLALITGGIVLLNARHAFLSGQGIPLWMVWLMPVLMGALWPVFWLIHVWVNFIRKES